MIKDLFRDLISSLNNIGWNVYLLLNEPIEANLINNFNFFEIYKSQNIETSIIKTLYSICNGIANVKGDIQKSYLAPHVHFNSFIESINIVEDDNFYNFKENQMLPIFQSFLGEYIAIKLDKKANLYFCSTYDFEVDNIVSIYDNIESMFLTLIKFIKTNIIVVDEEGFLVLKINDYESYLKLGMMCNPSSEYWKQKIAFNRVC